MLFCFLTKTYFRKKNDFPRNNHPFLGCPTGHQKSEKLNSDQTKFGLGNNFLETIVFLKYKRLNDLCSVPMKRHFMDFFFFRMGAVQEQEEKQETVQGSFQAFEQIK